MSENSSIYKYGKPLINLVHWWFIDRDVVEFNTVEKYHIDKVINVLMPMSSFVNIHVCFDTDKPEYRNYINEYFAKYTNIIITYELNSKEMSEFTTFRHMYDFNNCYIMYSHFKGIGCCKNKDGLSSFCHKSLESEIGESDSLYICMSKFTKDAIGDKIFYGGNMVQTYTDGANYIEHYSSKKFYAGTFYVIDVDRLKEEMNRMGITKDHMPFKNVHSELLPSLFPLSVMAYEGVY